MQNQTQQAVFVYICAHTQTSHTDTHSHAIKEKEPNNLRTGGFMEVVGRTRERKLTRKGGVYIFQLKVHFFKKKLPCTYYLVRNQH